MFKRKVYDELLEWKSRKNRKSLLIKGQRQVGKTFIIKEFGKENYDDVVYIDFNKDPNASKLFADDLDVDKIIKMLAQYNRTNIVPEKTIIIMDEIQECPRARASLKYFTMDGRYDVIASGSLLGVDALRSKKNGGDEPLIPVGYENHLMMYSMDFEEFLWANGYSEETTDDIRDTIRNRRPMNEAVLSKIDSLFRDFMIVGGMPESVNEFVENKNYIESGRVEREIIQSCRNDITRYNNKNDVVKTLECFDTIPAQLAKSNKKFMYSEIKGEKSRKASSEYFENLLWIEGAGYGNFSVALNTLALPLMSNENKRSFRVYLSDTGLLSHMYDGDTIDAIYLGDISYNFGAIVENAVAENLMKCGYKPRYYKKNSGEGRMELDFIITLGGKIAAIEVKSGKQREAPSLNKVSDFFDVRRKIMFEKGNICEENGVEHYPLFASAFMDELEPERELPSF